MADWTIRRLDKDHDRSAFDCGQPMLNEWLKDRAGQFDRRDLSRTFVATSREEVLVVGYYAISTHRVVYEALPAAEAKGLPRLDLPLVLIGRLAVDHTVQGQGLGALLLVDALRRSLQISEQVGIRAVEVDALDDAARNFYLKFGFRSLLDDPRHLFLPMHEIRKLKLDPI
ncbi:MAG: GNAT family N-acetyltransferase [Planctomycetaceae bacterium]|jgi:GNAT superfamily N-acetyltransferase|nr:GNAT family N-acetyltransferase [Planctomycetaceae bacterium]